MSRFTKVAAVGQCANVQKILRLKVLDDIARAQVFVRGNQPTEESVVALNPIPEK
jgi:hypothetical protein